jgi:hypothetical protein
MDRQLKLKEFILKESRHHFEGNRGKSHPAVSVHVFEHMAISLLRIPQRAKVAGFEGARKVTVDIAITVAITGGLEPAKILPLQLSRVTRPLPAL